MKTPKQKLFALTLEVIKIPKFPSIIYSKSLSLSKDSKNLLVPLEWTEYTYQVNERFYINVLSKLIFSVIGSKVGLTQSSGGKEHAANPYYIHKLTLDWAGLYEDLLSTYQYNQKSHLSAVLLNQKINLQSCNV